ncbi:hypothetical protein [Bradyrhizobium australafricanum]|uniref:hypothetical protein n=1 Tax=Bradyrhizobium australafricanum TaxID=2821406 RepID=UPI001CE39AFC|nr:hypothetical protein [Bradyrhizobium australafricanum]MCA6103727.1 hypothetical protein [Bradyrhizobium australafricanum]
MAWSHAARVRQARELCRSDAGSVDPDHRSGGKREQSVHHDRAADPSPVDRAVVGRSVAEILCIEPVAAMSRIVAMLESKGTMIARRFASNPIALRNPIAVCNPIALRNLHRRSPTKIDFEMQQPRKCAAGISNAGKTTTVSDRGV